MPGRATSQPNDNKCRDISFGRTSQHPLNNTDTLPQGAGQPHRWPVSVIMAGSWDSCPRAAACCQIGRWPKRFGHSTLRWATRVLWPPLPWPVTMGTCSCMVGTNSDNIICSYRPMLAPNWPLESALKSYSVCLAYNTYIHSPPRYRFSAFWLRSKCSICSYQLNI